MKVARAAWSTPYADSRLGARAADAHTVQVAAYTHCVLAQEVPPGSRAEALHTSRMRMLEARLLEARRQADGTGSRTTVARAMVGARAHRAHPMCSARMMRSYSLRSGQECGNYSRRYHVRARRCGRSERPCSSAEPQGARGAGGHGSARRGCGHAEIPCTRSIKRTNGTGHDRTKRGAATSRPDGTRSGVAARGTESQHVKRRTRKRKHTNNASKVASRAHSKGRQRSMPGDDVDSGKKIQHKKGIG